MENDKKIFMEPGLEIMTFSILDVLTTSDNDGWAGGDVEIIDL